MASFGIDLGWVGFGIHGGLLPCIELGFVRVWCVRGSIYAKLQMYEETLKQVREHLMGGRS